MLEDKNISASNKTIKSNARLDDLILEIHCQRTSDLIKRNVEINTGNNLFLDTAPAFNIRKQKKNPIFKLLYKLSLYD